MSRYICKSKETGVATNGNPWLRLTVTDKMGDIKAMMFNYTSLPQALQDVLESPQGKVFEITGDIDQFNGENQIKVKTINLSDNQDVKDLIPAIDHDYEQLQNVCKKLVSSIQSDKYRVITEKVLFAPDIWELFITKVAGYTMHHSKFGGLLQHSVGVAMASRQLAQLYPDIDISLVLSGALLHDIGKCYCYTNFEDGLDYTDDGKLFDHIVLGIKILYDKTKDLDDTYKQELEQIEHIIVSHHGQLQFGSPKEPVTIEAKVVSMCDGLDAFMEVANNTVQAAEQIGFNKGFSKFIRNELYVHELKEQRYPYYNIPGVK